MMRLLITFPPDILVLGARPSQVVKWRSLFHFDISVPTSERIDSALSSLIPKTSVTSTPRISLRRAVSLYAPVPEVGQHARVPLAREYGLDDEQAGLPVDVADHRVQLDVHQLKGLLHAVDVGR